MLELAHLSCERGGRRLFSDLQCQVAAGQLLRVQGANGAGKTSLLRMLCGLLPPVQGSVRWRGEAIADLREDFARELVYIGHAAAIKDDLTARENLAFACRLGGSEVSAVEAAAALREAGLAGRDAVPARMLSQGQRRRVALARLVVSPHAPLWVLDEPFNALDTAATAWLAALVGTHLARGGIAVLTSHQHVDVPGAQPPVVLAL